MANYRSFKVAALAAAVALAMGSTAVMAAAPAATQLPGQGKVLSTGTAPVATITADTNTLGIVLNSATVIDWNKGTTVSDINPSGVAGFNIGADATVNFTGSFGVLNLDSTGNPSQIFGALTGQGNVFVANSNGIIVGAGASISSGASVGLIGNALSPTAAADFRGGFASIGYDGTGGDVTVLSGATISGANKVFISGGGTVNVDLAGVTGSNEVNLSAGLPQAGGAFAGTNPGALLAVSNSAGATNTPTTFASAGDASSSGGLNLSGVNQIDGTFTNTGVLTLGAGFAIDGALVNNKTVNGADVTLGSLTNNGDFTAAGSVTVDGDVTNNGTFSTPAILNLTSGNLLNKGTLDSGQYFATQAGGVVNDGTITTAIAFGLIGGDLINNGTIAMTSIGVVGNTNGNIVNNGKMTGVHLLVTAANSDDAHAGYTKGAAYSITNAGSIAGALDLGIFANTAPDTKDGGATGGSFTNTGTLAVTGATALNISAVDDVNLGGKVTLDGKALSAAKAFSDVSLTAGGVLTSAVPLFVTNSASFAGTQVKLMDNVSIVDGAGNPAGWVQITAGAQSTTDYAVRVASGKTVSAGQIIVTGDKAGDNPNMILQGTLAANTMYLGGGGIVPGGPLSDVFSGPAGGLVATGGNPFVSLAFTGRVKSAPYLNDANFRYNYLPITNAGAAPLRLILGPVAYTTNSTVNGLGGVNVLVNGDVVLGNGSFGGVAPTVINGVDSAVTGVINIPNTHLVVQSTGDISTAGDYYWPGYVYLGTIASDASGNAQPGTLGLGTITLNGDFSNVLPGSLDMGAGMHFMTQFPMVINGDVTTNANAWVNFGTELLTNAYATGTLGDGQFFGGVKGSGSVVNYQALDESMFHTHLPDATR